MRLSLDAELEDFRAEFGAFVDGYLPAEAQTWERSRSSSHVPDWARRWQRLQFEHGWLFPDHPPEFGGRNATPLQQYVHRDELARRRIYHCFNPQGVGIIAASLLTFGIPEQQRHWAVPILRGDMTASLGMSEPGAGSDLPGCARKPCWAATISWSTARRCGRQGSRRRRVADLRAHRSESREAQRHQRVADSRRHPGRGVSALPSVYDRDHLDFNEVFFTDVRVPVDNLVGPLHGGWKVANGSLGHERTMMWMNFANRLRDLLDDFRPVGALERDQYATLATDFQALRLLGSAALARAARGERDVAAVSVFKLLGSEAEQNAARWALNGAGAGGLVDPAMTAPYNAYGLDQYSASWFARYAGTYAGTIAGGTSEIQRNIIAAQVLGLPRG